MTAARNPSAIILFIAATSTAMTAAADDWLVAWSPLASATVAPVPMAPWLAPLIALLLAGAAYTILRKRASGTALALAGTLVAGAMALYADQPVQALPPSADLVIKSATGSQTFTCQDSPNSSTLHLGADVAGGIALTVTGLQEQPPTGGPRECVTGTILMPGNTCTLYFAC